MAKSEIEQRLARIEAKLAIDELPVRYARAVDGRDIDGWVSLFVEDVNCGRHGTGREALKAYITPLVQGFYRSVHFVCGHVVDFESEDRATGTVYCRAEHEDGDQWVVMAIVYFDSYVRRGGEWYFERRRERHWYAADVRAPICPPFQLWPGHEDEPPNLPHDFPNWSGFWRDIDPQQLARITRQP